MADQTDLVADFRDAMATVCTPVAVVTAMDGERPHGTTVSAFASLSVDPPMVLVALDARSDLLTLVRRGACSGSTSSAVITLRQRCALPVRDTTSSTVWHGPSTWVCRGCKVCRVGWRARSPTSCPEVTTSLRSVGSSPRNQVLVPR